MVKFYSKYHSGNRPEKNKNLHLTFLKSKQKKTTKTTYLEKDIKDISKRNMKYKITLK